MFVSYVYPAPGTQEKHKNSDLTIPTVVLELEIYGHK